MSAGREVILERIRTALRDVPPAERPEETPIERAYRTADSLDEAERIELFIERVREYKAAVHKVDPANLPTAIAQACAARGVRKLVIPKDLPEAWAPAGVTLLRDPGLSNQVLDESDGVLTAATLGIAQTGTIVLDGGPAQGRRVISLLPDYHLCVIRADQIVGLVPEAVARLGAAAGDPTRPLTFISGPSATSDIELNRVEGVHGPRTLEVLVVTSRV